MIVRIEYNDRIGWHIEILPKSINDAYELGKISGISYCQTNYENQPIWNPSKGRMIIPLERKQEHEKD